MDPDFQSSENILLNEIVSTINLPVNCFHLLFSFQIYLLSFWPTLFELNELIHLTKKEMIQEEKKNQKRDENYFLVHFFNMIID